YLMSLMFFLSGLFVWPSILRKGEAAFLQSRFLRLCVPAALAVLLLMPLAHYPTYRVGAIDPGVTAYLSHWLELPFWPGGPPLVPRAAFRVHPGRRGAVQPPASVVPPARPPVVDGRHESAPLFLAPAGRLGPGLRAARARLRSAALVRVRHLHAPSQPPAPLCG